MRRVWIRRGRGEEVEDGRKEVVGRWGSSLAGRHDDVWSFAEELVCFRLRGLRDVILATLVCWWSNGRGKLEADDAGVAGAFDAQLNVVRASFLAGGGVWQVSVACIQLAALWAQSRCL
jgi:hypothetical protein